ncbi:hypothetical protein JW879_05590 [candidate division WOR-3 bacterium]|nr:hypothetical protein [candidate division WOR-3 bacterium]
MRKKIYFLGGFLSKEERKEKFDIYSKKLKAEYRDFAEDNERFSEFEFVHKPKCDRQELTKILKSEDTYGIIWFSHGDGKGRIMAYHKWIDDEPWKVWNVGEDGERKINPQVYNETLVNPKDLEGKAGLNVKFFGVFGCGAEKLKEAWEKTAPGGLVKAHAGDLLKTEYEKCSNIDHFGTWIKGDSQKIFEHILKRTPMVPDASIYTQDPGDAGVVPAGGMQSPSKKAPDASIYDQKDAGGPSSSKMPDVSDRIKILGYEDIEDSGQFKGPNRLSEFAEGLKGGNEPEFSIVPELSDRIKILDDTVATGPRINQFDEIPRLSDYAEGLDRGRQMEGPPGIAHGEFSVIPDYADRINILDNIPGRNPDMEVFRGPNRLSDYAEGLDRGRQMEGPPGIAHGEFSIIPDSSLSNMLTNYDHLWGIDKSSDNAEALKIARQIGPHSTETPFGGSAVTHAFLENRNILDGIRERSHNMDHFESPNRLSDYAEGLDRGRQIGGPPGIAHGEFSIIPDFSQRMNLGGNIDGGLHGGHQLGEPLTKQWEHNGWDRPFQSGSGTFQNMGPQQSINTPFPSAHQPLGQLSAGTFQNMAPVQSHAGYTPNLLQQLGSSLQRG